jgi:hypothetical protein
MNGIFTRERLWSINFEISWNAIRRIKVRRLRGPSTELLVECNGSRDGLGRWDLASLIIITL